MTSGTFFGLAFNNTRVFTASDSIIYICFRVITDGLPGSAGDIGEFDTGIKIVSMFKATVQITKFREFNAISALKENV